MLEGLLDHDLVTDGERVLLRFRAATANIGTVPVHLALLLRPLPDGNQSVRCLIFLAAGGFRDREASQFEFHPTPNHFQVECWAVQRLRARLAYRFADSSLADRVFLRMRA